MTAIESLQTGATDYNKVCIYNAEVHYGVSSYANFRLFKLGYGKDDARRGKRLDVLLGNADYVINLR